MSFVDVFGWIAAVVGAFYTMPQLIRVIRTGKTAGLPVLTWQLQSAAGLSWVGHGLIYGSPNLVACNLVIGAGALGVLITIIRKRNLSWSKLLLVVAVIASLVGLDFWLGQLVFGFLVLIPGALGLVLQLRDLITKPDISGVSPVFLILGLLIQAMWFAWGFMVTDLALIVVCGTLAVLLAANLVVWLLRRARGEVGTRSHPAK